LTTTEKKADTVGQQVYEVLGTIQNQLDETLAFLQASEIRAAWALAKWQSDTGAEQAFLNNEIDRKEKYLNKLLVQ